MSCASDYPFSGKSRGWSDGSADKVLDLNSLPRSHIKKQCMAVSAFKLSARQMETGRESSRAHLATRLAHL